MRKWLILLLVLALCGCAAPVPVTTAPETSIPETMLPETTVPETTVPATTAPTEPLHSVLYREGFEVEEILLYFQEVTNQIEYTDGTGFPGIREAREDEFENLTLSFLDPDSFRERFSDVVHGEEAWGATQYWYYTATNEIYSAAIGYRTDIPQADRNSIILEEIVNTLGISDSGRRSDSIVYQDSNENLQLSEIDWLLLELLYHPDIACGMDAEMCEKVIRDLYY